MHRLRPSSRTLGRDCSTKARNLQHTRQGTEGYRNQLADPSRRVQCEGMTRRDTAGAPPIYVRALRPRTVAGGRTGRISSLPSPHETRARSRPLRLGRCRVSGEREVRMVGRLLGKEKEPEQERREEA